jgi:formylglycine-generating enzyme required for sulfatase activity
MKNPSKDEKIDEYGDNSERVARGGFWWSSDPDDVRASYRFSFYPSARYGGIGFRIVRNSNEKS